MVKELIENALDAGARKLDILTDGGGRRLIRITDDGAGMTRDDLALAVERHATSKLDGDDLLAIRTLGFRGEALPSIGAVARLTITTRHAAEPHAWTIAVDGGAKSAVKPAALGAGTRVEVRDLFYATPARLKFLKTDRTEAEAIREVVRRLAMSRPDVAFTLAGEERAPVTWAAALPDATGRLARLGDVLGAEFRANAIPWRPAATALRSKALPGCRPDSKANALSLYLFVNGRAVRDKLMLGAVRAAYADYLPRDRHPVVALFITLDSREVDVNVHPAKTEVRFRDAGLVRAMMVGALREALARDGGRAPRPAGGDARRAAARRGSVERTVPAAYRLRCRADWAAARDAGAAGAGVAATRQAAIGRSRASRLRYRRRPMTMACSGRISRGAGGFRRRRPSGGCRAGMRGPIRPQRRPRRQRPRNLYRGADPRRRRHRGSARRSRAPRLRAA